MMYLQQLRMEQFNVCFLKKTTNWNSNTANQKLLLKWYLFVTIGSDVEYSFGLDEGLVNEFCTKYKYPNVLDAVLDKKHTYLSLAILTYMWLEQGNQKIQIYTVKGYGDKANTYDNRYKDVFELLYQFLQETTGYEMDEDERAFIFGTDPLYNEVTNEEAQKFLDAE